MWFGYFFSVTADFGLLTQRNCCFRISAVSQTVGCLRTPNRTIWNLRSESSEDQKRPSGELLTFCSNVDPSLRSAAVTLISLFAALHCKLQRSP